MPGRIPAQLVGHALFYLTKLGDLVLDPMAGGGVVSDAGLIFQRKCRSFDHTIRDNRPEILYHHWDPQNWKWPIEKNPDNSITIFDYHRLLSESGWRVTHRIECPLSSQRLTGNQVQKMQNKRILGTVGRTLLIAKRS